MEKEKQIEEIYRILLNGCNGIECSECEGVNKKDGCLKYHLAHSIYNAGYRKERQGEWIVCGDGEYVPFKCTACGKNTSWYHKQTAKYCPQCGAKMKGAENG